MAVRLVSMKNTSSVASRVMFNRISRKFLHIGEYFSRGSLNEIELQTVVPLAGRKHLVSSDSPGFPKHLSGPKEDFPMLLKARKGQEASMKDWALRSREIIGQAYQRYEKHGTAVAILFRGLPNTNERDFSEWVNNLGHEPFSYVGGIVPRNEIEPNVSDGAQDDNVITFEPHNEMAYSPRYPKIFTISCLQKSKWGGETGICDNRDFYSKLDPALVQKCEERKIRYWNCVHSKDSDKNRYQSWQMRFKTKDKEEINEYLKTENYNYYWEENTLFYWKDLSPTTTHPMSGEKLWFNQLTSSHASYFDDIPCFEDHKLPHKEYPTHTTYGDGEEFAQYEIDHHRRCIWESAVGFEWQNGDILFLDQMIVQHSRLSFEGDRKVGVSLLDY